MLLIRIGTRGSKLALVQANLAKAALIHAQPDLAVPGAIEIVPIRTSSDFIPDRSLADLGGKALFTKEIEEALLAGRIDVAVHSMKDVPTFPAAGLCLPAALPRGDVRDAFVSAKYASLALLPSGARIGTASLRRKAQLLAHRPDLSIGLMRGNVDTRLRKLDSGEADATLLALAGLERLGLRDRATEILPVEGFLPAAAQGIIGFQTRDTDTAMIDLLRRAGCPRSFVQMEAERALLAALDGSCQTPIGGYAQFLADGLIRIDGFVASDDARTSCSGYRIGTVADASRLGAELGAELRAAMPGGFWAA